MGPLRCAWRLPLLLLVVFGGCLFGIFLLPHGPRPGTAGAALLRNWSRLFLRCFGVRVERRGEPLHDPVMFVANHGSWMDISVLHAIRPADFVAKAEIGRWPLVGVSVCCRKQRSKQPSLWHPAIPRHHLCWPRWPH